MSETIKEFRPVTPGLELTDRYKIIGPLGEGAMGEVYRAVQNDLGREVAIKVIKPMATARSGTERFINEMKVTSRLAHPHIATVLDAGTTSDGRPFYVMELLYGETLAERVHNEGQQSPYMAAHVGIQILHGICEAHRLGIVHRDLKPSNVMLCTYATQDDFVKVVDFGLARSFLPLPGCELVSMMDMPTGTIAYMAPEQLRCLPPGPAMDVYAVGHILAELLLGHSPYHSLEVVEVVRAKLGSDKYPFESPILDGPLGPVVAQAVANDPRHRYRSAEQMLEDLEAHAQHLSPSASRNIVVLPTGSGTAPEMPEANHPLTRTMG